MSSASDSPRVQASLALLSQTCSLSIAAINAKSEAQAPPLSTLHADAISLLSVIYSNTTKLSIALNPSNPAYSAALAVLKDLTTHSSTLASNASLFFPNVHGRALTAEVQYTAKSVLSALQELAHAHLALLVKPEPKHASHADTTHPRTSRNGKNDAYLAKTGVVHDLIAQAKAEQPQGLSKTNLIAVRKRWREHSDIIADAAATLESEASPADDADDEDEDFDDGWDDPELGLSMPGKLGPDQVELAKAILNVVRRTSALFDDIRGTLLPPLRAPTQPPPNALLDNLLDSAPPLVDAVDNLATQVYGSPDDLAHLSDARDSFARALSSLASAVKGFWKGKEGPRRAHEKGSRTYFTWRYAYQ
ncbi:hypothetical protein BC826DRAFT_986712 [Russula brevipes]|nr:hypothetical protein BC826DRAFT_986712 [Russula brevipes]